MDGPPCGVGGPPCCTGAGLMEVAGGEGPNMVSNAPSTCYRVKEKITMARANL